MLELFTKKTKKVIGIAALYAYKLYHERKFSGSSSTR